MMQDPRSREARSTRRPSLDGRFVSAVACGWRVAVRLALPVVVAGVVAACGSSSSTSSSISVANAAGTSAVGASQVAAAQRVVDHYAQPVDSIGLTEKLSKLPTGKRVDFVNPALPITEYQAQLFQQAAQVLGMKVTVISQGKTASDFNNAFDQVLQNPPDGVIVPATQTSLYQKQFDELTKRGIPIVTWTTTDPDAKDLVNLFGTAANARSGNIMANYIIAQSKGNAHVVFFDVPAIPALKAARVATEALLKTRCPKCSIDIVNSAVTDIGTTLPGMVVSYVQKHPDTTYVFTSFSDMLIGVPAALTAAGISNVKLVSQGAGVTNQEYIVNGQQQADIGYPNPLIAWTAADTIARMMTGQSAAPDRAWVIPFQLLTKQTINFDPSKPWPVLPNYQQEYKALWGVG